MYLLTGTWDKAWGHTFAARGNGRCYALQSLPGGSFLWVYDRFCRSVAGTFSTPGAHSCHLTLLERQAVVADYTSGSLSLFPLDALGMPSGPVQCLRFEGNGPHPERQASPHLHSSWLSPDGRQLVALDLGTDHVYRFPVSEGRVVPEKMERISLPPGCGPRHAAFGKEVLYVSTELSDEVLVFSWPSMSLLQRVNVNPAHPEGGGHLLLSPDGRFLYASSRLQNDGIAVFRVGADGLLEAAGYCTTASHPRHFCLTPDAETMLVACRDGDCVQFLHRSAADGSLLPSGQRLLMKNPVFVEAYEED